MEKQNQGGLASYLCPPPGPYDAARLSFQVFFNESGLPRSTTASVQSLNGALVAMSTLSWPWSDNSIPLILFSTFQFAIFCGWIIPSSFWDSFMTCPNWWEVRHLSPSDLIFKTKMVFEKWYHFSENQTFKRTTNHSIPKHCRAHLCISFWPVKCESASEDKWNRIES